MSRTRLLEKIESGYLKKFRVEIDLTDLPEHSIELILEQMKAVEWDFIYDLIKIIEREK